MDATCQSEREQINIKATVRTLGGIAATLLILVAPVDFALSELGADELRVGHALSTTAALFAALALAAALRATAGFLVLTLTLVGAVFVRSAYFGLVRFSGRGFTDEVFLHLDEEAVQVAWMEYRWLILVMLGAIALVAWWSARVMPAVVRLGTKRALLLACISALVLTWQGTALPEVQLAQAIRDWYSPRRLPISEAELARWRASGLVDLDLVDKHNVVASPPPFPRNLVLLYLESGGAILARHPQFPDLMPNLRQLMDRSSFVQDFHSSAYITIEGIVNSMCGTLFPFRNDSDSMAGSEGLAEWMPCLGDVLGAAGYNQTYFGGAGLRFAGKGAFLRAHGYDTIMGIEEWRDLGISERPGTWGLSDADLLERSHAEIARLRKLGDPFNLTLLTIGTHLPGYRYDECTQYRDGSERFLDAVSCTDQLLGRWLDRLRQDGVLKDTLVVITADHHVFPSPEMKRLFGTEAVEDRRLPLIVLGDHGQAAARSGASYDLAPTVLDLLDIQHNGRFALGRSLLQPGMEREAFFRKYEDINRGAASHNPGSECRVRDDERPPDPPLDSCEKGALLNVLALQHAMLSIERDALRCDSLDGVSRVMISESNASEVSILLNGREQSHRFTDLSRAVDAGTPGMYVLELSTSGSVAQRRFVRMESARKAFPEFPNGAGAVLVTWLGSDENRTHRPGWLPAAASPAHAWLFDGESGALISESSEHVGDHAQLVIDRETCRHLFGTAKDGVSQAAP